MPFHSPEFLLLCLLTFGLYYLGSARWQHAVLLISSLAFYYYAGLVDTVLLLSAVGVNYLVAFHVARGRKEALAGAIAANLGMLGLFKYRAMLVTWANLLTGQHWHVPDVVIPLGISFYLFQLIAYQVEVYRQQTPPESSFFRVLLYILFFPHHQAGPIMRPATFLPQFYGPKSFDYRTIATGGLWILWGLTKKVLADNLAWRVDAGFNNLHALDGVGVGWSLALRYALQIYGDFSGYSDIALGLGLLFGYKLDRNFDQPYLATNPSAFWARWHITLSAWLRDYLYIPLGGNRKGGGRTYVNLMLTMLLGGLWHGASIMFLLWGFLHGLLLVIHRRFPALFAIRPLGWAITFGFTVVAWVPFRAPSWAATLRTLSAMFGFRGWGAPADLFMAAQLVLVILAFQGLENLVLHTEARRERASALWARLPGLVRGMALGVAIVLLVTCRLEQTTYIYFRF